MAAGLIEASTSTAISAAVSAPAGAKWFDTFDDTLKNYIATRGLAEKDPATAFAETAKAHQEAQAYIGVPSEQLLRLPKADAAPEEWDAVYERLGYVKDAKAYTLDGVKFADGSEVDDSFRSFIQTQAQALKLSPAAATKLAAETVAYLEKAEQGASSEDQIAAVRAAEQLRQSWGPNYEANMVIADRAYLAMQAAAGFTPEQMRDSMTKLRDVQGTEGVMQILLAVGQRLGEHGFIDPGKTPADPNALIASREQAVARKAELLADDEWKKRFSTSGSAEIRQMAELDMRIVGVNDRGEPL